MGKRLSKNEPAIVDVRYNARLDRIRLFFPNSRFVDIPRKDVREFRNMRAHDLRLIKADNAGMTISQRERDIDVYVPGLLQELFLFQPAVELGRKGGSRQSPAKARTSAANGVKGGRPRKKARNARST